MSQIVISVGCLGDLPRPRQKWVEVSLKVSGNTFFLPRRGTLSLFVFVCLVLWAARVIDEVHMEGRCHFGNAIIVAVVVAAAAGLFWEQPLQRVV